MTTTASLHTHIAARTAAAPGARPATSTQEQGDATRKFDAIFAEAIDERPAAAPEPEAVREPTPAPGPREAPAEDAKAADPTPDPEASGPEGEPVDGAVRPEAEPEAPSPVDQREPDGPVVGADGQGEGQVEAKPERSELIEVERPNIEPLRGKRAARVSAGAIRAEMTHAAEVDLASINARELTQPTKPGSAEPPPPVRDAGWPKHEGGDRQPSTPAVVSLSSPAVQSQAVAGFAPAGPQRNDAIASRLPTSASDTRAGPMPAESTAGAKQPSAGQEAIARLAAIGARTAVAAQAVGPSVSSAGSGGVAEGKGDASLRLGVLRESAGAGKQPAAGPTRQPVLAHVQRGLATVLKNGGGTLTMKLNPQSLGEVRVEVTLKEGAATARFEASTPSAHRLLTDNLSTLRQALEAKGVRVETLSVELRSVAEASPEAARGERPGTDAGRVHQEGGGSPNDADGSARSDSGAWNEGQAGRDGPGHRASMARAAGIAGDVPGSEHPEDAGSDAEPFPMTGAGMPGLEGWIGLDTVA